MNLLNDELLQKMTLLTPDLASTEHGASRAEKIANFNKEALKCESQHHKGIGSTFDFQKKINDGTTTPLSSLSPIKLADLEAGITHRGRVVYGRIATKVIKMVSIMVLIEDESDIVDFALYGDSYAVTEFRIGRLIAIKEPYFKLRQDGTEGIRVDNPRDVTFDSPDPTDCLDSKQAPNIPTFPQKKRGTVLERLQEILLSTDGTKGVDKLYRQLADEGKL